MRATRACRCRAAARRSRGCAGARGEAELLSDLDRERGDAACVLFGRRVLSLRGAPSGRGARAPVNASSGGDDLMAARRSPASGRRQPPRRGRRSGEAPTRAMLRTPEDMAEPPAEIHEAEHERSVERAGEQHDAEHDGEVGSAAREEECVHRANGERAVDAQADGEQRDRGAERRRNAGNGGCGIRAPDDAERDDAAREHGPRAITRDRARRTNCGSADSAITKPPTGSVAAPVTAIRPFGRQHTRCRELRARPGSEAISAKPPPTITVRVSPWRAPAAVIATARTVATSALTPTP